MIGLYSFCHAVTTNLVPAVLHASNYFKAENLNFYPLKVTQGVRTCGSFCLTSTHRHFEQDAVQFDTLVPLEVFFLFSSLSFQGLLIKDLDF